MIPESVRDAHARVRPVLEEAQRYIRATLQPYASKNNYLFVDRLKDASSLAEKLESGRFASWSQLDDLYACTIVTPVASQQYEVVQMLGEVFEETAVRSRSTARKSPDVFRFDGLRWYGRIRREVADTKQPGLAELTFEVQVITAFEWAWGRVTHDLVYKGDSADWRHKRLAAHLKASVEQIELLITAFDQASAEVQPSPWPETDAAEAVLDAFQNFVEADLLPPEVAPASWSRFADNVIALVKSYERNSDRLVHAAGELTNGIEQDLSQSNQPFPTSISLFQYVLEYVSREDTEGNLNRFTVVPSSELALLGLVSRPRKEFQFDGISVLAEEPGV